MRTWSLSHSRTGWQIHLYERPAWAVAISRAAEYLPEPYVRSWPWRIGLPGHDGRWSLGAAMYHLHGRLLTMEDRHERELHRFPVHHETAETLQPDFAQMIARMYAEEEIQ